MWSQKPSSPTQDLFKPCEAKGVLKIVPPSSAQGVEITMEFLEEKDGWVFDLGDSTTNNGYGNIILMTIRIHLNAAIN